MHLMGDSLVPHKLRRGVLLLGTLERRILNDRIGRNYGIWWSQ